MKGLQRLRAVLLLFLVMMTLSTIAASLPVGAMQTDGVIKGKVTDIMDGSPLPGVSIIVKGTSNGTTTDGQGEYTIKASSNDVLIFTYIGYTTEEVPVSYRTTIDVGLNASTEMLEQIVIVGYGSMREKDLTGAITTVSEKDFQKGFVTNAEQLIANKMPGVQVIPTSGRPGSGGSFLVRGGASLNASNDPLIVIDGVPLEGKSEENAGYLSRLNPNDIESFTVLKDASAAAIYGARGSNGVIIVTTKKGKQGPPKFSFSSKTSLSTLARKESVLNANQYREAVAIASEHSGLPMSHFNLGSANTDWQNQIYQNAFTTDNKLSMSGSVKNLPYRVSVSALSQEGILKTSKYDRYTGALDLSPSFLNKQLNVRLNVKGGLEKQQIADERAITSAISYDPTQPIYSGNTQYNGYFEYNAFASNPANIAGHYNPLGMLMQADEKRNLLTSVGNIVVDYKLPFLPELSFNINTGYDLANGKYNYYMGSETFERQISGGLVMDQKPSSEKFNTFFEAYTNYEKEFSFLSSRIDAMIGYSLNDFRTKYYYYPNYTESGEVIQSSLPTVSFDIPRHTMESVYGRVVYTMKDRYHLTATVRKDGSTRFSDQNRWGTFPSLALAWNMADENFLTNVSAISNLKLRVGYGITGQQDGIGNYDYIRLYNLGGNNVRYPIGSEYYNAYKPGPADVNRKWEYTATTNLGLDWGLFNNRISGSVELYYKETSDLLNQVNVPVGTDFTTQIVKNIGSMNNRGVEFIINGSPIQSKDLNWNVMFNFTYNKNEITSLSADNSSDVGLFSGSYLVNSVGYSRNTFYLYKQAYDAKGNPIEEGMIDVDKNGIINASDRYRSKSSIPQYLLGFSTNLQYKKFTLSTALHANLGHYMYYNSFSNMEAIHNWLVPHNLNQMVLKTGFRQAGNQLQPYSDYYLQNASFLKMDYINLSYNVGTIFRSFNTDAKLSLVGSVQNVFVVTKYTGVDPEASWNWGIDTGGKYPIPRTFSFGINLDF